MNQVREILHGARWSVAVAAMAAIGSAGIAAADPITFLPPPGTNVQFKFNDVEPILPHRVRIPLDRRNNHCLQRSSWLVSSHVTNRSPQYTSLLHGTRERVPRALAHSEPRSRNRSWVSHGDGGHQ